MFVRDPRLASAAKLVTAGLVRGDEGGGQRCRVEAELDFDPTRGVPLPAFVHRRVLARALTRYRREWAYARRCGLRSETDRFEDINSRGFSAVDVSDSLQRGLDRLPEHHRRLIRCLYWEGKTEVEIARLLSAQSGDDQPAQEPHPGAAPPWYGRLRNNGAVSKMN